MITTTWKAIPKYLTDGLRSSYYSKSQSPKAEPKKIIRVSVKVSYAGRLPKQRIPTQENAISSIVNKRKNWNRSIIMARVVLIKGPNVFVNYSMNSSLIQKRKADVANR